MQKHQRLLQDTALSLLAFGLVTVAALVVMGYEIRPVFVETAPSPSNHSPSHAPAPVSNNRRASFRDNKTTTRSLSSSSPSPAQDQQLASNQSAKQNAEASLSAEALSAREAKLKGAMRLVDEGNWQEAEKALQELLAQYPDFEMALSELAMIYYIDKRDPNGALPYMERSLKLNPNNTSMINEMIAAYQELGRPEDALQSLQQLSQAGQSTPALESGMARLLRDQGRYEDSIQHLQKGLSGMKGDEATSGILEEMGDTYQVMGDGDKAVESYYRALAEEKSRARSPNDPAAFDREFTFKFKAALAFVKNGKPEEARHLLQELEMDSPGDVRLTELRQELNGGSSRF